MRIARRWWRHDNQLASGEFAAGESIDGGSGTDSIVLANATTVDFSTGTITGVENLTGTTGILNNDTVTMSALQWAGFSSINWITNAVNGW